MLREVRARVTNGKLEPLEDLHLSEGDEVIITVKQPAKSPGKVRAMLERTSGAWAGTLDFDEFLDDLRSRRKVKRVQDSLDA